MILIRRIFVPVLICLLMVSSAKASFFDDLLEGKIFDESDLRGWNTRNSMTYKLTDTRLGCSSNGCNFTGTLTNNTNDIIEALALKIMISNGDTKKTVLEEQVFVSTVAVPSVSVEIDFWFNNDRMALAYEQLGDKFQWNRTILGAVPVKSGESPTQCGRGFGNYEQCDELKQRARRLFEDEDGA
jgi:hypothetical protein